MEISHTDRFTNRAENYARYRPHYPKEIVPFLAGAIGLTPHSILADIGSGTGLLTELWLENGNAVYAVEPNQDMRRMADQLLAGRPGFHSIAGTAEATTLPAESIDIVTAGSAFHWFDPAKAHAEFVRILKSDGWAVLAWNSRRPEISPFAAAFNQLLHEHGTNRHSSDHRSRREAHLAEFFQPGGYKLATFPNSQDLDLEGTKGRLLSLSSAPLLGEPGYEPMMAGITRLFEGYQQNGVVRFEYLTQVFYGRLR